eukprot:Plantae.Rhodophyta-Palmaria_palmata.ctg1804.p1 GENE.Plantae.Rhodophyta-Palmaria_palmata.ctg1804~~Plantae.Rhodophyta-Palmaria_palmata.ctg1804.p1  ORF type:complete len:298 (+),score=59.28 Plantae.Rhodophyta-Palmaria_palmata.ctg1804:125-1018(+)
MFDLEGFCRDVRLCYENCMLYCPAAEPLHGTAKALLDKFNGDVRPCPRPVLIVPLVSKKSSVDKLVVEKSTKRSPTKKRPRAKLTAADGSGESNSSEADSDADCDEDMADKETQPSSPPVVESARAVTIRDLKNRLGYLRLSRRRVLSRTGGVDDLPMTREEKSRLSQRVGEVPADKIPALLKVWRKFMSVEAEIGSDEIEIDLNSLSPTGMREVETFVDAHVPGHVSSSGDKSFGRDVGAEFDSIEQVDAAIRSVEGEIDAGKSRSSKGGLWDDSDSESSDSGSSSDEYSSDEDNV